MKPAFLAAAWAIGAASAQAEAPVSCTYLGAAPLSGTFSPGPGPSATACFDFSATAGPIEIVSGDAVAYVLPQGIFQTKTSVLALTLAGPDDAPLAPTHIDRVTSSWPTPEGGVPYPSGYAWWFDGPAAGSYRAIVSLQVDNAMLPYSLSIGAVPEPETAALALAGIAAVGWRARRRA